MTAIRHVRWLVAGVAVITGCGASSEPGTGAPADPLGGVVALSIIRAEFNVPTIVGLNSLSRYFNYAGLSAPIPAPTRAPIQALGLSRTISGLVPSMSASRTPIPGLQNNTGITFEYDPNTLQYVAGNLTGAPANGIRVILYAVNPGTGAIGTPPPLTEVGHADLTDEGVGGATYALGVQVQQTAGRSVTDADYGVTVTPGANSFTAGTRPAGPNYVTDGSRRVDFTASIAGSAATHNVTVGGNLTLNDPAMTLASSTTVNVSDVNAVVAVATFSFTQAGETGSLTLHAVIDGNGDLVSANATVRVDNRLFATVTKTAGNSPVVSGPGGRQLTSEEEAYVEAVLEMPGEVFDIIGGLVDPGVEITGQDGSGLHI